MRVLSACGFAVVTTLLVAACSGKAFESAQAGLHDAAAGSTHSGGSSASNGGGGNSNGGASATGGSRTTGGTTGSGAGGSITQGGAGGTVVSGGTGGGVAGGSGGSVSSGGSMSGDASTSDSGPPVQCNSASDCPDPGTVCQTAACLGHQCGFIAVPTAVPPSNKVGDCQKIVCTQNGAESTMADPTDSDDGNPCTADSCSSGIAVHAPNAGAQCANGYCDQSGRCVQCVADTDCPSGTTECTKMKCVQGTCQRPPPGTLCNGFLDQCDDKGNCVDCWNSGGCDECCVCLNGTCIPA